MLFLETLSWPWNGKLGQSRFGHRTRGSCKPAAFSWLNSHHRSGAEGGRIFDALDKYVMASPLDVAGCGGSIKEHRALTRYGERAEAGQAGCSSQKPPSSVLDTQIQRFGATRTNRNHQCSDFRKGAVWFKAPGQYRVNAGADGGLHGATVRDLQLCGGQAVAIPWTQRCRGKSTYLLLQR